MCVSVCMFQGCLRNSDMVKPKCPSGPLVAAGMCCCGSRLMIAPPGLAVSAHMPLISVARLDHIFHWLEA